jgi:hypothetical protein
MNRLLGVAFFLLLAAAAVVIVATSSDLPPEVASHFGSQGKPNAWQSVGGYRAWILAAALALPCFTVFVIAWLPRRFPRLCKLPHRDYWLAPERRDATYAALASFAYATAIAQIVFALGIHYAIVMANAASPPRMPNETIVPVGIAFMVAIVAIVIGYRIRFRAVSERRDR